jgi:heme-degrading monooxygenase HmoA
MRDRPPARAIRGENDIMAIYQSMQRVRFRSAGDYEQFKLIFAGVRHHLKTLPGFLHLTWWTHPDDPTWHNEVSFWTSFDALKDWHMNTYHKHAKQWAVRSGAIMEDIITNFELKSTRLIRVCPCCGHAQDKPYELDQEQHALAQPCSQCGFHFPRMPETPDSFAVFKDIAHDAPTKEAGERKPAGAKTAA